MEAVLEEADHIGHLVVVAVLDNDQLLALTCEGILLTVFYLVDYLCIELVIIYLLVALGISIYDIADLHH